MIFLRNTGWFERTHVVIYGTGGNVVVNALYYKPQGSGFDNQWGEWMFSSSLPAALGPGLYSASNRNEYQKQKNCFWGVEGGQSVGMTTLPPSVSRLSTPYGVLNISQSYIRPTRPVTAIALLYLALYTRLSRFSKPLPWGPRNPRRCHVHFCSFIL
jgi:hypothetical protein